MKRRAILHVSIPDLPASFPGESLGSPIVVLAVVRGRSHFICHYVAILGVANDWEGSTPDPDAPPRLARLGSNSGDGLTVSATDVSGRSYRQTSAGWSSWNTDEGLSAMVGSWRLEPALPLECVAFELEVSID